MREHLGHALPNGFALLAERVELGAGALGIGEARTQRIDFLQEADCFLLQPSPDRRAAPSRRSREV